MRPSKLRLPLSTAATTRSSSRTASATGSGSGPAIADAVVDRDCARDEGVQIVHREVEDVARASGRRSMTWSAKVGSVSASFSTQ